ncbi:hypothetical protein QP375_25990, partial [Escherichia coli]|nr:hypothetical protein [Escherichia coli]
MKKLIAVALSASILAGCAHTDANPSITEFQPGDNEASCAVLHSSITTAQRQADDAHSAHNWQVGTNIFDGIAGAFVLVPWFFIDVGTGNSTDEKNAKNRVAHLRTLLAQKHCDEPLQGAPLLSNPT